MSEQEATQESGNEIAGLPPAITESDNGADQQESNGVARPANYTPYVDLSTLPDDIRASIEGRFKHMSSLMRKNDTKHSQKLSQWKEIAEQQSKQLEELTNGFGTVVNHLQDKTYTETESQLKLQMKATLESGDIEGHIAAQDKLLDIKAEKKMAEQQRKLAPEKKPERSAVAVQDDGDGLAPEDREVVNAWQDERDESGMLQRPWAYNRGTLENPDKQYLAALAETRAVLLSPLYAEASMAEKMAEVDRRMGVKKQASRQTVMGGGLTGNRKTNTLRLTPQQEEIAVRMKLGGPKATREQSLDLYKKQLETIKQKGARK